MNDPRRIAVILSDALLAAVAYILFSSVSGLLSDALIIQKSLKLKVLGPDLHKLAHLGYLFWWFNHYDKFTIGALVLWAILVALMTWYIYSATHDSRKQYRHRSEYAAYGTARWQENGEVNKHYLQDPQGLLLGAYHHKNKDEVIPFALPTPDDLVAGHNKKQLYAVHPFSSRLNQQYIIFAPPGFGKTSTLGIPNVLYAASLGINQVITDPKGELYFHTSETLRKLGYEIIALDHLDFKYGNRFNPLDYITEPEQYMELADMYISANKKGGQSSVDPFWDDNARGLLAALIGLVKEGFDGSLPDVQRLTNHVTDPNLVLSLFQRFNVGGTALRLMKDFLAVIDSEKTAISIVTHLKTHLQLYTSPRVIAHADSTDFDLRDLTRKKVAIYLRVADNKGTYGPVTSLFWSTLFDLLYDEARKHGGALQIPVLLLQDEMANIGTIPDLTQKLTTMRSRNIFSMMIWHDYPQLERKYGQSEAATIVGACATKILIAAGNIETANKFSEMIGDTTIETQSRRENPMLRQNNSNLTSSFTGRRLMQSSELTSMDLPWTLVLQTSRPPVLLNKVLYDTKKPTLDTSPFEELSNYAPQTSATSFIDQLFEEEEEEAKQTLETSEPQEQTTSAKTRKRNTTAFMHDGLSKED